MADRNTLLAQLRAALRNTHLQAFFVVIRVGEGTADGDGYRRLFGGDLVDSLKDHPRIPVSRMLGSRRLTSTAAGAYQFLSRTWDECAKALGLTDFSPLSQDLAAAFLIRRRGALAAILAGRIEEAIRLCAREWASLPGSPYGQPTKTMAQALATYRQALARLQQVMPEVAANPTPAPQAAEPEPADQAAAAPADNTVADAATPTATPEPTMPLPAFIAAALPAIVNAIPVLGKLFGSGSQVAERNVAAAQLAVGIVQQAVGARNAQETVELLASEPGAVAAATEAVQARWLELSEAGGGGIDGARKHELAYAGGEGPWWSFARSPSFWWAVLMVPPLYTVVGSIVGLWGQAWPSDVRAAIATAVVSLIVGGGAGYYWGQTTSRNRTPAVPGQV
jgi:muramidase (phage lysozyme)